MATDSNDNGSGFERPLRIYVAVDSSYHFLINRIPLTGIQRVEVETGRALIARGHTVVVWSPESLNYREIPSSTFYALTDCADGEHDIDGLLAARRDATGIQFKDIMRLRLGVALSLIVPKIGPLRLNLIKRIVAMFGRTARALSIVERKTIARLLKLKRVERRGIFLSEYRKMTAKVELQAGDVLFVPSPLGYSLATRQFVALAERGVLIVPVVYDLYLIRAPWVHLVPGSGADFAQNLALLSHVSDLILTISNWTARDLSAWFVEENLRIPHIVPVQLAAGLRPSTELTAMQPKGFPFASGRYVLMPGSFSAVKNQNWAHMLWRRLYERLGNATWPLVFAGQRGHKEDETIERIQNDPGYGRTMYWVVGPSDAELSWLYANCGFIIAPAEFEGWGLTLSEGLAFGKPCLSSGRGALAEAGQGVVWESDTIDGVAWLDQCSRWMNEPETLAAEQVRIRREYHQRNWEDVADEVIQSIRRHLTF